MRTIWKFPFEVRDTVTIAMPKGARILPFVASSPDSALIVWAEVDPEAETEDRVLYVVGTGHSMPNAMVKYLGTAQHRFVQLDNIGIQPGVLVWHVYEKDMLANSIYEQNLRAIKDEMERSLFNRTEGKAQ